VLGESDVINAMLKDHDGKIWIAANTGLFIYDPSRGEFIETTDTPVEKINQSKETVLCLFQSRDNSIWAGTMNNGVFRIKDDDVEQFQTSSGGTQSCPVSLSDSV
jgi:ligand-binding sensor domain-containing protein